MTDFKFLQNPLSHEWIILAPRRAKRPEEANNTLTFCPFCLGSTEIVDQVLYRFKDVVVLFNKFPFTRIHEVIIHSPDHHKNFEELPEENVEDIITVFKNRFNLHKEKGSVIIFHNHGLEGGESLPHPHTQLAVVPKDVAFSFVIPDCKDFLETKEFLISCPSSSQWPDEVVIMPKRKNTTFGDITNLEIKDLAFVISRIIKILDIRHGHEFPFNFYISPNKNWHLRLIPRFKKIGGFELATNIYVNTQDPKETMQFIKDHFENIDAEKIKHNHKADYGRGV